MKRISEHIAVDQFDFDPGDTAVDEVGGWLDMKGYDGVVAFLFSPTGLLAGACTLNLRFNTASDGSGTDVDGVVSAATGTPDAATDRLVVEATAEDMAASGSNLRAVTAIVSSATATDEGVVVFIRYNGAYNYASQFATRIA